ncbi:enolase C-terminal domain-like protein [Winogradskya humida]|nr:enolase C-terminal domain-like protein [Actinoplanes humidus]
MPADDEVRSGGCSSRNPSCPSTRRRSPRSASLTPGRSAANAGALARSTSIPLATSERLFFRHEFREVLGSGLAAAQPDVSHAGGISEVRRIAAMTETYDVTMAPTARWGRSRWRPACSSPSPFPTS